MVIAALGLSILSGVVVARTEPGSNTFLIGLLATALAFACVWAVVWERGHRAGIAAASEATLAAFAFLLLPLNAVRLSSTATVGDVFLLALLVPLGARLATRRAVRIPSWLSLPVVLVSVSVFAQAFMGLDLTADLIPGVLFLVAIAGTPLVLSGAARNPGYRDIVIVAWLVGSSLAAAAALADASGFTSIGPTLTGSAWDGRWAGLTVHPNHLGLVAVMAFPVAVWWLNSRPGRSTRVIGAVLAGLLVLGVLVSGSRAALISLLVVGAMSLLAQIRNRNGVALSTLGLLCWFGVVVGAVSLIMPTMIGNGLQRLLIESASSSANQDRLDAMMASLSSYYGSPLVGVGFSTIKVANNLVLQAFQSGGLLTAFGLVVYLLGAIMRGLRISRVSDGLGTALALSLFAWVVDGMFQNIIYDRFLFLPVALVLAVRPAGSSR